MTEFTWTSPPRILFGWGQARQLPGEAARLGRRPLVICGGSFARTGRLDQLVGDLREQGMDPRLHAGVPPEPDLDAMQAAMDATGDADCVIAIGGGSVLDVAKGAAALAAPGADIRDYFAGRPVPDTGRPLIAVPTTSGTGSEVTWVSVLVEKDARRKASIRGPAMMPTLAIVDPELTVSCPVTVTAHSGLDAFVQAVEAYTSRGANPVTDALALDAALLTARWVETAVREPAHQEAREAMSLGSMMAGMALNTSRLGLVHGLAHPIGAVTGAAHGLLCGLLMPAVMRFNEPAAAEKYARLAVALGLAPPGPPRPLHTEALIAFTEDLLQRVQIPLRLGAVGFDAADLDWVAAETLPSGSTRANPRPVTAAEARAVVESVL